MNCPNDVSSGQTSEPCEAVALKAAEGVFSAANNRDSSCTVSAVPDEQQDHKHGGGGSQGRKARRPRKIVYYFDSDSDAHDNTDYSEDQDGNHAEGAVSVECDREDCSRKRHHRHHREEMYAIDTRDNHTDRIIVIQSHRESREKVSIKNPRIGSPTPIGFFAFGVTTALYNVHNAKICPMTQATMGLVIFYGGLTQFVVGWFELINMNTFGCTISTTYGAFWMATWVLKLWAPNEYVVSLGTTDYTGGFFLLWFFFAGTLFACSFKSPLVCITLFFAVMLNFFLQSVGFFTNSDTVARVAGYEGIFCGSLATYIGMAMTMADVYGRSILPLFPHENFRNFKW